MRLCRLAKAPSAWGVCLAGRASCVCPRLCVLYMDASVLCVYVSCWVPRVFGAGSRTHVWRAVGRPQPRSMRCRARCVPTDTYAWVFAAPPFDVNMCVVPMMRCEIPKVDPHKSYTLVHPSTATQHGP